MDNINENDDQIPSDVAFGWVNDPVAVEAIVSTLPYRSFGDTPAFNFSDTDVPDHFYLWDYARKATGNLLPPQNQGQVGSCVSFGTSRAVEYTLCVQIAEGATEEFKKTVEESVYGGSRVEIGGRRLGRGDGSIGAWAADWVKKYGIINRGIHGKYDLTSYSESRCRDWGWNGVPNDLEPEIKLHPVKDIVPVVNWEQAKKALIQGYGISICSDQGFSMRRGENGIARATGNWNHCMCLSGFTTINGKEYGRIDNSWGANAHSGPVGPGEPGPEGFYAESSVVNYMLSQKDSFAFSTIVGFPIRKLRWII